MAGQVGGAKLQDTSLTLGTSLYDGDEENVSGSILVKDIQDTGEEDGSYFLDIIEIKNGIGIDDADINTGYPEIIRTEATVDADGNKTVDNMTRAVWLSTIASEYTVGVVKPDGTTITVADDGTMSAVGMGDSITLGSTTLSEETLERLLTLLPTATLTLDTSVSQTSTTVGSRAALMYDYAGSANATPTATSSDESVATVYVCQISGNYLGCTYDGVAKGTATITVSVPSVDGYNSLTATQTITVTEA